jgi:bifunctional non-homologous end joining protein LigD
MFFEVCLFQKRRIKGEDEMLQMKPQATPLTLLHRPFGVKKHWATNTHYDLRLEWKGVLLSWALRMGPTRTPGVTRKAVQMPDHDLANLGFEGIHQSGTIMCWDSGTWEPCTEFEDIDSCLDRGILRFRLHGEKLEGSWTLTNTNESEHGNAIWVLSKDDDDSAVHGSDNLLEDRPHSVKTGRTKEEIECEWNEGKTAVDNQGGLF